MLGHDLKVPLKVSAWLFHSRNKSECRHVAAAVSQAFSFIGWEMWDTQDVNYLPLALFGFVLGWKGSSHIQRQQKGPGPPERRVSPQQTELWIKGGRAGMPFGMVMETPTGRCQSDCPPTFKCSR